MRDDFQDTPGHVFDVYAVDLERADHLDGIGLFLNGAGTRIDAADNLFFFRRSRATGSEQRLVAHIARPRPTGRAN